MRNKIIWFLICILLLSCTGIMAADDLFNRVDEQGNLRLGNDYIVIVVNQDQNARGRFAIETTGGAPFRNNDNYKPLVYGRPKPWTSYTTLRINGENYVFGGDTEKRAGKNAKYGKVISGPRIKNNSIHTLVNINGLSVEQILKIVKSSTTGLYDSVQIKYRVKNETEVRKDLGLRIMLDTMLGQNDGAPFRLGDEAITSDVLYSQNELPNFWQAFDSISSPRVTSQGTFKGNAVTTPDKVYFSDWGSLADGSWYFDFNKGEEFIRKGEYEIDSAIAMVWNPQEIKPGQEKTYITNYGLGGITIVPGLLSLGVTSPAEVTFTRDNRSFPVIAYVENTSEITAEDVKIRLKLPDQFTADDTMKPLGDFSPGDIAQVIWNVRPVSDNIPEKINYGVVVEAENTDSNEVKREVNFVGPPIINASIKSLDKLTVEKEKLIPNPFTVQAEIKNTGGSILYDAMVNMNLGVGLEFASREKNKKYLGYIETGESIKVNWEVKALRVEGETPFAVTVKGLKDYSVTSIDKIDLPRLNPVVYLEKQDSLQEGDKYITIDVKGENIYNLDRAKFTLEYNPEFMELVYVSRGNIFIKDDKFLPWNKPVKEKGKISFDEIIPANIDSGIFTSLHFKIKNRENLSIDFSNTTFTCDEEEIDIKVKPFKYKGGSD